jgi:hypothetical protein
MADRSRKRIGFATPDGQQAAPSMRVHPTVTVIEQGLFEVCYRWRVRVGLAGRPAQLTPADLRVPDLQIDVSVGGGA